MLKWLFPLLLALCGPAAAQQLDTNVCGTCTGDAVTATGYTVNSGTVVQNSLPLQFTLPFSVAYSIKMTSISGNQTFLSSGGGVASHGFDILNCTTCGDSVSFSDRMVLFNASNNFSCSFAGTTCQRTNNYTGGAWHDVVKVVTSTGSWVYVDGVQTAYNPTLTPTYGVSTGFWSLGNTNGTVNQNFALRDVAVWNRGLRQFEAQYIHNRHLAGIDIFSGNADNLLDHMVDGWTMGNCDGTGCAAVVGSDDWLVVPAPTATLNAVTGTGCDSACTGTVTISGTCSTAGFSYLTCGTTTFVVDGTTAGTATGATPSITLNSILTDDSLNPHTITMTSIGATGLTGTDTGTFSTNNGPYTPRTFYLSVAGSDSNNGTSPATPWLSPNHTLRCGDTILAIHSQSYLDTNFFTGKWGTAWSCSVSPQDPSITGLPYFAWLKCDGSFVQDCLINTSNQGSGGMRVSNDHWAIQGWTITSTQTQTSCFAIDGFNRHYLLFLNDYAKQCTGNGFSLTDYGAIVGSLAYGNAYNAANCSQGVSTTIPLTTANGSDTETHAFIGGSFIINNHDQPGCTDGNGFIVDDQFFNASYNNQLVVEQNLFVGNGSLGIAGNGDTPSASPVKYIVHNTLWGNGLAQGSGRIGQFEIGSFSTGLLPSTGYNLDSNILVSIGGPSVCKFNRNSPYTCPPGLAADYAINVAGTNNCQGGGAKSCTLSNSYVWDQSGNSLFIHDPSTNITIGSGVVTANPGLSAPSQVFTTPDCSASAKVIDCVASITAKFVPSGGAAALGYQPPGACTPDALYPIWLKGAIPSGYLTKPCGY